MEANDGPTPSASLIGGVSNPLGVTDKQAEAVKALSDFGTTTITEVGQLARYAGRVLGTVPEDAVGLVIGDPLHFIRTVIAQTLDRLVTKIFDRRGVTETQPVSPSLAIPLLRAAYDESRPEVQQLWAELIAAAMDPSRSGRVRLSFVETLRRLDPLDALVLKERYDQERFVQKDEVMRNSLDFFQQLLSAPREEIELSIENLEVLKCCLRSSDQQRFFITNYGRQLMRLCSD